MVEINPFLILLIAPCCEPVASITKTISSPLEVQFSEALSHKLVVGL